ncbi:hypothetical protein ACFPM3_17985 [Streptomyces coeruleoprunus]|uniref:Uncharacterized protein n=1 Tax=Streptomyces coeruleoprunus TaxID=285563 RepID=A0ABV9XIL7_9ACTN
MAGVPGGEAGAFEAATGDGAWPPRGTAGERRAAEVRVAFEGMLQIRRLTATKGGGDPEAVPAVWERNRPVRAVALVLESAGFPPSGVDAEGRRTATGYRVGPGERAGSARVEWLGPPGGGAAQEEDTALTECARALERLGWEALLYRGPRRRRFLEVEAMDVAP